MNKNPVIGAIFESMSGIRIIFEPTHEAFKNDKKNTGDSREYSVKDFLESFFPKSYTIKKGPIYNLKSESQEIDCVILAPNHPSLITPKREVIIAEGVYAAVEVKPDITCLSNSSITDESKSEFRRALGQIQSVKRLDRILPAYRNIPEGLHKIPCVLFSKKSRPAFETINYIKKCIEFEQINSIEVPDIIVTLDHGLIFHSLYIQLCPFNNWAKFQTGEKYIYLDADMETTLGIFILLLLCFNNPELLISDHIIKDYIKYGIENIAFHVVEP